MLCFAANGGAHPMAGWKSCDYYEVLIGKGYIEEQPGRNVFFRCFMLTDKGRDKITEMVDADRVDSGP